ncbi:MAG: putative DNA-binding domain-containing protein [Polyangiaceae bacterium]
MSSPSSVHGPEAPASLRDMQTFVVTALQSTSPVAARTDLAATAQAVATGNARMTPAEQVEVYREQFWLRHIASLAEDFPTVKLFIGGAAPFAALSERYLAAHPPQAFRLEELGARMSEFLRADAETAGDSLLADCAAVEYGFIAALSAADPRPFDPTSLAGASEDALMRAKLVMQAPLRLVATEHPVHELRDAVRAGETPPRPPASKTHLAIFRSGIELRYFALEPAAFAVVEALLAGLPLDEACDRAIAGGADEAEIAGKLSQWFQWWTQWGWLERVVL